MVAYGVKVLSSYECDLLKKMFLNRYIGGRHTDETSVLRGFPKHDLKKFRKALKGLVRLNLVIEYKSTGQTHVSINPVLIRDIKKIMKEIKKLE